MKKRIVIGISMSIGVLVICLIIYFYKKESYYFLTIDLDSRDLNATNFEPFILNKVYPVGIIISSENMPSSSIGGVWVETVPKGTLNGANNASSSISFWKRVS